MNSGNLHASISSLTVLQITLFFISYCMVSHYVIFKVDNKITSGDKKYDKYVSLKRSRTRLGNQMFLLASGFAIAKRMERTLLYYDVDKLAFKRLKPIVSAFPRTAEKFVVRTTPGTCIWDENYNLLRILGNSNSTPQELVYVPFAQNHGNSSCWKYDDPLRYFNHSAKYLVLETNCGQNARFFEDILPEIREMYQFSDEVREQFAHLAECEKRNITCIHTRQTDFIRLNRTTDLEETVMAAYNISEQHSSQQYLIFGDDRTFMAKLATRLKQVDSSRKKTYISSHREIEDMYLSSQLCTSFLISSAMSTFGWWLAFFAPNQHSVYYMNDKRPNYSMEGIPREEMFLSSWRKYS